MGTCIFPIEAFFLWNRFYTTSLAVKLIFGGQRNTLSMASNTTFEALKAGPKANAVAQPITTDTGSKLSIVVETNFKIYAYTSSTLHVAMLSVFLDVVVRLRKSTIDEITLIIDKTTQHGSRFHHTRKCTVSTREWHYQSTRTQAHLFVFLSFLLIDLQFLTETCRSSNIKPTTHYTRKCSRPIVSLGGTSLKMMLP